MDSFHKLLTLTACLVLAMLAMVAPNAQAQAGGSNNHTVTGTLHVTETNSNGDVMNYTITDINNEPITIHVQPPNAGATADINSHEGQKVTAKYHDSGTPAVHVHDGFKT